MLRKYVLIFFLVLTFCLASGQTRVIDSLNTALYHTKNDTVRLVLTGQLSYEWLNINSDSSLLFADLYINFSEKLGYRLNKADGLRLMAYNFIYMGNYPRALETLFDALKETEEIDKRMNQLPPQYLRMLKVPDHLHSIEKYRLYVEGNIHMVFWLLYYIKGSDKIYMHVQKIQEIGNATGAEDLIAHSIAWNGFTRMWNDPDSAIYFLSEAVNLLHKSNSTKLIGPYTEIIGNTYHIKGDHESELKYYRLGLAENLINDNIRNSGFSYIKLANCFSEAGLTDSIIFYAQKALSVAKSGNYPDIEKYSIDTLAGVYKRLNQQDSAYKYQGLLVDVIKRNSDAEGIRQFENVQINHQLQEQELSAAKEKYQARVKLYGLLSGSLVLLILALVLLRINRISKKANVILGKQKEEIIIQKNKAENALAELKSAQAQLIQSEKMASLGELTAGIAHEIQNPLNFVNNFSEVSVELVDEMKQELAVGSWQSAGEIAEDIRQNLEKISHHGKRADAIVKGMLQHSRTSSGQKEPTDINALADEYLRLAYHGLRARDKSFNAAMKTDFDKSIGKINIIPQDIGRVILNLITNAFYAVNERNASHMLETQNFASLTGISTNPGIYEPTVTVTTRKSGDRVEISVKDNGNGIPDHIKDKIFQPFFTTKPTGQGTGLGLSLSYDIVKAHGGELKVETKEGEGTEFIVRLPV
jgi:two-component system, NtrC family, sensor kinase